MVSFIRRDFRIKMLQIAIIIVLIFIYARVFGTKNIVFVFLTLQSMSYVPIMLLSFSMDSPNNTLIISIHLAYSILLLIFCFTFSLMLKNHNMIVISSDTLSGKNTNFIILTMSLVVCCIYYYLQGGLFFFRSGDSSDVSLLRLSYYSTENSAAGYVNQFKNVLLPLTATVALISVPNRYQLFLGIMLFIVTAPLMTGTGQRFPIVYASVIIVFSFYKIGLIKLNIRMLFFIALIIFCYGLLSITQARSSIGVIEILINIWERIFFVNQIASINTFPYMVERGFVYGSDWYQDILSISPSIKPSTINRELFGYLWGSNNRGNSPPSLPSSLYFNFGFAGIVIVAAVTSWIITQIEYRHLRGTLHFSRYIAMIFIAFSISKWTSSTLLVPLNAGLLALLVYLFVIRIRWG